MLSAETQERPTPRGAAGLPLDAGRLQLISRIASDLAHEINNPLHASIINLEVLRKRVAGGRIDEADERADVIEAEIRRVHGMVDLLMQLLRPDPATDGPVDAEAVVRELAPLIDLRARLGGVGFGYHEAAGPRRVRIGRDALRFAVLHLTEPLLDALRATDGRLDISTDEIDRVVAIRIIARAAESAEPRARDPGNAPWRDRCDAAVETAAQLVRDSGGRIARDARGASTVAELVVLLPGIDRA